MTHPLRLLPAACIALFAWTPSTSQGQPEMLPPAAGEWSRTDSVGVYAGKELYLLVNGGADLFLEYGFVRALSSEYTKIPDARVETEIYEMKDSPAAYGLFTSFTAGTGTAVPLGQEAVLGDGYCIFWKGHCVGMLTASSSDSTSGQMVLQLAGELEKRIRQRGSLPGLCALLRKGGLDSRTMVYIRGKLGLRNHFPHAWTEALPQAEGVVGESRGTRYLAVECASADAADAALRAVLAGLEKLSLPVARSPGGGWTFRPRGEGPAMIGQNGRYMVAVSDGDEQSEVLANVLKGLEGK